MSAPTVYKVVRMVDGRFVSTITNDIMVWTKMKGYGFSSFNVNDYCRRELLGQPKFRGLIGPIFDGYVSDVAVVRYECPAYYEAMSS